MLQKRLTLPSLVPLQQYYSQSLEEFCEELQDMSQELTLFRQSTYTFPLSKILRASHFEGIRKLASWIEH